MSLALDIFATIGALCVAASVALLVLAVIGGATARVRDRGRDIAARRAVRQ